MARTVAIGIQDFEQIRKNNYFYVDKTDFIKEWWESGDSVCNLRRAAVADAFSGGRPALMNGC